ncbi:MAG: ADP-glyceromanno-heptose 6-epimerase [Desulfonatronovibrionaceae bacterium]
MHIVTGGAGFIGSGFVYQLNTMGTEDILVVDNLGTSEKWKNLVNLRYRDYVHRDEFLSRLEKGEWNNIQSIIHMGACSSTTEKDADFLMQNNLKYSRALAKYCLASGARFICASSAATYGDGSRGFEDQHQMLYRFKPLNMYGYSKHLFDLWALKNGCLDKLVCLKFFNVYGPNEYHKKDMQSVVRKAYFQILKTGRVRLFRSCRPDYEDGGQKRDFIYLKDCLKVMAWLLENPEVNGVFNLGSGRARTWNDLARCVFRAMNREPDIEYIDLPEHLQGKYQYYTRAPMDKLRQAGCPLQMHSLEQGIKDYVTNYLSREDDPFLGNEA